MGDKNKLEILGWVTTKEPAVAEKERPAEKQQHNVYTAENADLTRAKTQEFVRAVYGDLSDATIESDTTSSFQW